MAVTEAGAFVALGALGLVVFRLGAAWFNPAAGALAAAIVLTRRPVWTSARVYVDVPYLVLVLGALLVETRRPPRRRARAGAGRRRAAAPRGLAVLRRLRRVAVVGRAARRAPHRAGRQRPAALGAADLVVAGDPLYSLTGTREGARELGRITGLDDVPLTVPAGWARSCEQRSSSAPRAAGCSRSRTCAPRALPGAVAGALALAAFCVLAAAGLPILGRYLLRRRRCWRSSAAPGRSAGRCPRGDKRRRAWAWFGALTLVLLVAFAPHRPGGSMPCARRSPAGRVQRDLAAPSAAPSSDPPVVPAGDRPQPPPRPVALWLTCRPARSSAPSAARRSGRSSRPRARAWRPITCSTRATPTGASPPSRRGSSRSPPTPRGGWPRAVEARPCTLRRGWSASAPVERRLRHGHSRCAHRRPLKAASFRT